jgi:HEPN domain-containing protein
MTPRVEAWIRQAQNDLDAARLTASQGFHAQACDLAGQAAERL